MKNRFAQIALLTLLPRFMIAMAVLLLSGCSSAGYYWQSVSGHLQILNAARPVAELLADPQTPELLKLRLALSQRIRSFAATDLKLPDNASYRRYADLHRHAVVFNVTAAPEFSLTLKTWCFAVAGCVSYRGYFNQAEAQLTAQRLKSQGLEVNLYGVPAYSTLGKLDWWGQWGADPLLNTFIAYPEGELARLIFHELAHQLVYVADDSVFNESFATAVERLGAQRWLATQASPAAVQEYAALDQRRQQFRALTAATRRELTLIYASNTASDQQNSALLASKKIAFQKFTASYEALKKNWVGTPHSASAYDAWVAQANNASFGAQAAYDEWVPGFEALFERQGRNWQAFYDAVRQLAELPKNQRYQALKVQP